MELVVTQANTVPPIPQEAVPNALSADTKPVEAVTSPPASARGDEAPVSKKPTFTVSEKAVEAIRRQIQKRGTPDTSLRVGVRGGGCSGFSYVVEFHDGPPRARDVVLDHGDVRVLIDPKSLLYLDGSVLEWEQTLLRQGFKFVNPNEKSSCGCGHSFSV